MNIAIFMKQDLHYVSVNESRISSSHNVWLLWLMLYVLHFSPEKPPIEVAPTTLAINFSLAPLNFDQRPYLQTWTKPKVIAFKSYCPHKHTHTHTHTHTDWLFHLDHQRGR